MQRVCGQCEFFADQYFDITDAKIIEATAIAATTTATTTNFPTTFTTSAASITTTTGAVTAPTNTSTTTTATAASNTTTTTATIKFATPASTVSASISGKPKPAPKKLKLVYLGDAAVGKSSAIERLVKNDFFEFQQPTTGAAYLTFLAGTDSTMFAFEIWDTAGQGRYRSLAPMYYRCAAIVVIVYDITSQESFEGSKTWVKEFQRQGSEYGRIVLAGNKLDLESKREVAWLDAQAFAIESGVRVLEISAKTSQGMDQLVKIMVEEAHVAARSIPLYQTADSIQIINQDDVEEKGAIHYFKSFVKQITTKDDAEEKKSTHYFKCFVRHPETSRCVPAVLRIDAQQISVKRTRAFLSDFVAFHDMNQNKLVIVAKDAKGAEADDNFTMMSDDNDHCLLNLQRPSVGFCVLLRCLKRDQNSILWALQDTYNCLGSSRERRVDTSGGICTSIEDFWQCYQTIATQLESRTEAVAFMKSAQSAHNAKKIFTDLRFSGVLRDSKNILGHILALCEALRWNTTITLLDLSRNGLNDMLVSSLVNGCHTLRKLDLHNNNLSSHSGPVLGSLLMTRPPLTALHLGGNKLGQGAEALFTALLCEPALTHLNVANNSIPDESVPAIACLLRKNHVLEELELQQNLITSPALLSLMSALANNRTLNQLDLGGNQIEDSKISREAIDETLLAHPNLVIYIFDSKLQLPPSPTSSLCHLVSPPLLSPPATPTSALISLDQSAMATVTTLSPTNLPKLMAAVDLLATLGDLSGWSTENVATWLDGIGMGILKENFKQHGITGIVLTHEQLEANDLAELGLKPGLQTRSFLRNLAALKGHNKSTASRGELERLKFKVCDVFHQSGISPQQKQSQIRALATEAQGVVARLLSLDWQSTLASCQFLKELHEGSEDSTREQAPMMPTAECLVEIGIAAQKPFEQAMQRLMNRCRLSLACLTVGPVKRLYRVQQKLVESGLKIFDINRATVVCSSREEFAAVIYQIPMVFGKVIKMKNKFLVEWVNITEPPCLFYQLELCDPDPAVAEQTTMPWVVEIQVTTSQFLQTKAACHSVYEITRSELELPSSCPICHY